VGIVHQGGEQIRALDRLVAGAKCTATPLIDGRALRASSTAITIA
jgi:hypothetical protein